MYSMQTVAKISILWLAMISVPEPVVANEIELPTQPLQVCPWSGTNGPNQNLILNQFSNDEDGNIYQAQFDSTTWTGTVKKFSTTRHKNNGMSVSDQVIWDAAIQLNSTNFQNRQIFTRNATTDSIVPFQMNQLSDEIQEVFNRSPGSGKLDNLGSARINYLSGDRTLETPLPEFKPAQFRKRAALLGDVINSIPVYEGGAKKNILDKNYPPFFKKYNDREGVIYVGANDGMLHAFSSANGSEIFAFIPSPLLEKLPALTDPAYQHDTFMDGKIRVSEAQISGNWLTLLAAGMGSGARGVFALDVTAPASFIHGRGVVFEFTDQDDADMGFVASAPVIAKLQTGKNSDGTLDYRYFVLVTDGHNSSKANEDNFLFVLSLDKPARSAWVLGKNYYKIKTETDKTGAANALAEPGLVLNLAGAATLAFAGDLQGNLWRFDFSNPGNPAAHAATRIFNATDPDNRPQPITVAPAIAYAPGGGYAILFGTGKYIENADTNSANFTVNSFYAIHDQADQHADSRHELASRSLTAGSENGKTGYKISGADFNYGAGTVKTKKGWFIDFPDSKSTGERMISAAATEYGAVFFNTVAPGSSCQHPGSGHSYRLDVLTGKTANPDSVTGIKSDSVVLGTPILIPTNSELSPRNSLGQRTATQYFSVLNFNSGIEFGGADLLASDKAELKSGRQSWRELPDPGR